MKALNDLFINVVLCIVCFQLSTLPYPIFHCVETSPDYTRKQQRKQSIKKVSKEMKNKEMKNEEKNNNEAKDSETTITEDEPINEDLASSGELPEQTEID